MPSGRHSIRDPRTGRWASKTSDRPTGPAGLHEALRRHVEEMPRRLVNWGSIGSMEHSPIMETIRCSQVTKNPNYPRIPNIAFRMTDLATSIPAHISDPMGQHDLVRSKVLLPPGPDRMGIVRSMLRVVVWSNPSTLARRDLPAETPCSIAYLHVYGNMMLDTELPDIPTALWIMGEYAKDGLLPKGMEWMGMSQLVGMRMPSMLTVVEAEALIALQDRKMAGGDDTGPTEWSEILEALPARPEERAHSQTMARDLLWQEWTMQGPRGSDGGMRQIVESVDREAIDTVRRMALAQSMMSVPQTNRDPECDESSDAELDCDWDVDVEDDWDDELEDDE